MGEVFKALLLLIVGMIVVVASYIGWLLYLPVSETDVSARIWNACMIGQAMTAGPHGHTSCDCFVTGFDINETNVAEISRHAEVIRQVAVAVYADYWSGTYDRNSKVADNMVARGGATVFIEKAQKIDRTCKVRPS